MINVSSSFKIVSSSLDDKIINKFVRIKIEGAKKIFLHQLLRAGRNVVSSPGEYPIRKTGRLGKSIKTSYSNRSGKIDAKAPYAIFLTTGTNKMKARKMLKNALTDSLMQPNGYDLNFIKINRI